VDPNCHFVVALYASMPMVSEYRIPDAMPEVHYPSRSLYPWASPSE